MAKYVRMLYLVMARSVAARPKATIDCLLSGLMPDRGFHRLVFRKLVEKIAGIGQRTLSCPLIANALIQALLVKKIAEWLLADHY